MLFWTSNAFLLTSVWGCRAEFDWYSTCETNSVSSGSNWMSAVPDGTALQDMSIPGTHDSMSHYGTPLEWVKTQDMRLPAQFAAGIRFIDIRIARNGDHLKIVHGTQEQKAHFRDALRYVREFLDANNRETILMRIKKDSGDDDPQSHIRRDINTATSAGLRMAPWTNCRTGNTRTTLREVRGRLIVLQDFNRAGGGDLCVDSIGGMNYRTFATADDWEVMSHWDFGEKKRGVRSNIQASHGESGGNMRLTFLSASGVIMPYKCARVMNDYFYKEIIQNPHDTRYRSRGNGLGIVAMDWPGSKIIEMIKAYNPSVPRWCTKTTPKKMNCKQGCPGGWSLESRTDHGCCKSFWSCGGNRQNCQLNFCIN